MRRPKTLFCLHAAAFACMAFLAAPTAQAATEDGPAPAPAAAPAEIQLAQAAPPPPPRAPRPPPPAPVRQTWRIFHEADQIHVHDVIAVLRIRTEDRQDVAISIANDGPLPDPQLRVRAGKLIIDGQVGRGVRCTGDIDEPEARHPRYGLIRAAQFPILDVRLPRSVKAGLGGALYTTIGASREADVTVSGCGQTVVGPVEGDLDFALSGSGDAVLGAAGAAKIQLAGAGDVALASAGSLDVSIAGVGDVVVARLNGGPARIALQGQGDVVISDGEAESMTIAIAGAGDVVFRGEAGSLDATIAGAGDVVVRRVEGRVSRRVFGAGEIVVGR